MKKFVYKAYTRVVNERTHYFVKKFEVYTDVKNINPILVGMGMNTDFLRACELAHVEGEYAVKRMMDDLGLAFAEGRALPVRFVQNLRNNERGSRVWYPQYWLSKLKWAHI